MRCSILKYLFQLAILQENSSGKGSDGVHKLSRVNKLLLIAVGYAVVVNVSLALHRRYEAGLVFLLGVIHLMARVELERKGLSSLRATLSRRLLQLAVFVIACLIVIFGFSKH